MLSAANEHQARRWRWPVNSSLRELGSAHQPSVRREPMKARWLAGASQSEAPGEFWKRVEAAALREAERRARQGMSGAGGRGNGFGTENLRQPSGGAGRRCAVCCSPRGSGSWIGPRSDFKMLFVFAVICKHWGYNRLLLSFWPFLIQDVGWGYLCVKSEWGICLYLHCICFLQISHDRVCKINCSKAIKKLKKAFFFFFLNLKKLKSSLLMLIRGRRT